ncbi:MAG: DUF481 domain-containing protein, partial [Verrucomicrobia bacterium]|nr:DUF481 domain-containing protein [Verrucomicrobiota bacterium]
VITKEMQQQLDDLLNLYEQDQITPVQYQQQRARILSPPPPATNAVAGATNAPPPAAHPTATAAAKAPPPAKAPPAQVKAKKPKHWKVTVQFGGTDEFAQNVAQNYTANLTYNYVLGRLNEVATYLGTYGTGNGITTANSMNGTEQANLDIGKDRKFFVNLQGDAGYDEIARIDLHYGGGPGLGYHVIGAPNTPNTKFILDVLAGTKYSQFNYADGRRIGDIYISTEQKITWHISPKTNFTEDFTFLPREGGLQHYHVNFNSALSYALTTYLSLNLNVVEFYDTDPSAGASHNDLKILSTIGVTF